jgi:hypothetical protein
VSELSVDPYERSLTVPVNRPQKRLDEYVSLVEETPKRLSGLWRRAAKSMGFE